MVDDADIEADGPDPLDHGPLIKAAFNGDLDEVRRLLASGYEVNGEGEGGGTALHGAVENSRSEVVRLLIERGADVNLSGPNRWTPITHAIDTACDTAIQLSLPEPDPGDVEIIRLLLLNGADPALPSPGSRDASAGSLARSYGKHELAAVLDVAAGLLRGLTPDQIAERVPGVGPEDVSAVRRFIDGKPGRAS